MRRDHLLRWWGPLAGSIATLLASVLLARIYLFGNQEGMPGLFNLALRFPILAQFTKGWLITEVLSMYLLMGFLGWVLCVAFAPFLVGSPWRRNWRGRHALAGTLGGFLLIHGWLWWKVPTAMWVIPGLRMLPLWLSLLLVPLAGMLLLRASLSPGWRGHGATVLLAGIWIVIAQTPFWLRDAWPNSHDNGGRSAELVLLAIDGVRPDVAYAQGLDRFRGLHATQATTPIPATRMVYSLLWGGDPLRFTSGHIMPDVEEYEQKANYYILQEAKAQGKKVRFFIDDGGTIGLTGRGDNFDRVEMPSRGWENFIDSNLSVHLPIYASWLDVLRLFPTTNPWGSPDLGLRTALEQGRGADWVFFHSCLIHQPIFLTRRELTQVSKWWNLSAWRLEPISSINAMTEKKIATWDERMNPFLAYSIRSGTLLRAWAPIWNGLAEDPQYGKATRVFFSDHGERFPHATKTVQMQGEHGFDLSPWELYMPLIVDAPGQKSGRFEKPVSLLGLRVTLHELASNRIPPTLARMSTISTVARMNIQKALNTTQDSLFVTFDPLGIVQGSFVGPDGFWAMRYDKPADKRGENAAVAILEPEGLAIYRPLKKGGALRSVYRGYEWIEDKEVDETTYRARKADVEEALRKLSLGN